MSFKFSLSPLAIALSLGASQLLYVTPISAAGTEMQQTIAINIASGSLTQALSALGNQTGVTISYAPKIAEGVHVAGLTGRFTSEQALRQLLQGTGLIFESRGKNAYILRQFNSIMPVVEVGAQNLSSDGSFAHYSNGQVSIGSGVGLLGNQSIFDTPYSIISFTSKLIEDQQAKTVADVIVNDSSTLLKSAEGGIGETISVRGFNTGSSGTELYDGLPGLAHRRITSIKMLERVEILKGANALLSGADGAPGGIVNLVPKQPLDTPLTRLTTSYEYKEALGTHLDLSRRGGKGDEFGVRFNGAYQNGESAIENSENELKEATLALQYQKEKLQLDAVFDYSEQDLNASPQQFRTAGSTKIPDAPDASKAIQQPWETANNEFNRSYVKAQYQVNDIWSVHGSYGVVDFEEYWLRTAGNNLNGNGDFDQFLNEYYSEEKRTSARVGAEALFDTGSVSHQVSLDGVRFTSKSGWLYSSVSDYNTSSNLYHPTLVSQPEFDGIGRDAPTTSKDTVSSFAIADIMGFYNDQLLLTVGARHQEIESISYNASTGEQTNKYKESAITPSVGAVVKPSGYLSIYGNYIESLEQGPTAPNVATNRGEVFEPTKSEQIEFGAKWDLGTLGVTTSIFQIEKPTGLLDANSHYGMNGEQKNQGVELNAFGNLTQNLRLLGGVTYIDAKLNKTQQGENDNNRAVGVPEWAAVMGFEWDAPTLEGLTLTGRVNHVGSQYVRSDNSLEVPSYELYSLGARYTTMLADKEVTFRANIDNLLDEEYWTTFVGIDNLLYTGASRNVSISATIDF